MVIDSSAVVALLRREKDYDRLATALVADTDRLISTATLTEVSIVVLAAGGEPGLVILQEFLSDWNVVPVPVSVEHSRLAVDAFRRFGKGRHRAALNFGDCFSYALARATGQALLFKGDDFSHTDINIT
jgi:ribonuclease VapC